MTSPIQPILRLCTAVVLASALAGVTGCRSSSERTLTVFAASSLGPTLQGLERAFEQAEGLDVRVELSGSTVVCRKVADQERQADVVLVADAGLIDDLLIPDHATFNVHFAANALVLAYNPETDAGARLAGGAPWQEILSQPGVRVGVANPKLAPVGERALRALELNDQVAAPDLRLGHVIRKGFDSAHQRPDVASLLAPLQAGDVDAAFVYRTEAELHRLAYVALDKRIDFSTGPERALYGLTVPKGAHEGLAQRFVETLLSDAGRAVAREHFLGVLPHDSRDVLGESPQWVHALVGSDGEL